MERAASNKSVIIQIMIEDMQLNDKFSFIIENSQRTVIQQIDNSQENVINLVSRISNILELTSKQKKEIVLLV